MQKVITITTTTTPRELKPETQFNETEYPVLNKHLQEGWSVSQVITIIKPASTNSDYALVFVLDKP